MTVKHRAALLRWVSVAILTWFSIWIFFFQHATPWQLTLLLSPVLSALGLAAVAVAGRRPRLGPWSYWFGALLLHIVLAGASNPSFFASWRYTEAFLLVAVLGTPILLASSQAAIRARILCGICIVLSLASLLDNIGIGVRPGVAGFVNSEPGLNLEMTPYRATPSSVDSESESEGMWIEIPTDRSQPPYRRSQKASETWILFLTWIALAALRPATRRDWLAAAGFMAIAGLAIATGYSWMTRLTFVAGICVFLAVLSAPRFMRGFSLAALLVVFLGAPVAAEAAWSWFTSHPDVFEGLRDPHRFVLRLARYEYWAEMIERQPWTGLGLGAFRELPGLPFHELFGARAYPASLQRYLFEDRTLFPHNFALHVWGELGAFGVLLATGFVASLLVNVFPVRRWDVGAAARVTLLAAVLLVHGVDRVAWTEQNAAQLFLAAGLAAGTMRDRDRSAPATALPGLSRRGERLLILSVLLIGLLVAAGNRARIHLADSRYVPEHTLLDVERGEVRRHRAEEIVLDGCAGDYGDRLDGCAAGFIDRVARRGGNVFEVRGWASDPAAAGEVLQVLVFHGAELLGATRTGRARPDLQRPSSLPNLDLLFAGFSLRIRRQQDWNPQPHELHAVVLGSSGSFLLRHVRTAAGGSGSRTGMQPCPAARSARSTGSGTRSTPGLD